VLTPLQRRIDRRFDKHRPPTAIYMTFVQ